MDLWKRARESRAAYGKEKGAATGASAIKGRTASMRPTVRHGRNNSSNFQQPGISAATCQLWAVSAQFCDSAVAVTSQVVVCCNATSIGLVSDRLVTCQRCSSPRR